ncbi:TniQ family protein [Pseudomonas viridiflava]|uniref:TniQ family protein n=4 Tax=Pseudomonas viridiflava TaxID=33069 RepID=UPI0013CEE7D9
MDAPYSWHSGARCLNPRWPLTPNLLPDELFSSWLIRAALAHGCTLDTLTLVIRPHARPWHHDFDRGVSEPLLMATSRHVGLSAQALAASTLQPVAKCLHESSCLRLNGPWPWFLVLGCRGAGRTGGLQCCPLCIGEAEPHYRVQARLAWHTSCTVHKVLLIDRCPHCLCALHPGMLRPTGNLAICHKCLAPLGDAPRMPSFGSAPIFQEYVDALHGRTAPYGLEEVSFCDWMFIARAMVSLLQVLVRQHSKRSIEFCRLMNLEGYLDATPSATGLPFEFLSPADRSVLLGFVWAIMQAGPERFIESASEVSLPVSVFTLPSGRSAPAVLSRIAQSLTRHSARSASATFDLKPSDPSRVLRMWERLQRRIRRDGIR